MVELIAVHVAWNDDSGAPCRLVSVEFTHNPELCSVETDVLDGDYVSVQKDAFTVHQTRNHKLSRSGIRFPFQRRERGVGNAYWDMLWMTAAQAGRWAEHLQRQPHWSLNCAAQPFWAAWESLSGAEFVVMLREESEKSQ